MTIRDLILALGGYRSVAKRLGKKPTTVHTHMQAGALPAAWYDAICTLAREKGMAEPSRTLFSFLSVEREDSDTGGAE
ncbi:hypothetical protein RA19_13780 [Leisingera sp. ANG-M1]|uniref:hypothetical protein n=1 Tax=Leisingera sp. ANG-M1 TaxID=1577895 RepID=UPI00057DCE40|nr:hypothetical protein [Leisingera sp. ANG-M1]KIC09832.1 hypothetical protein RA19_13780 [Leisingera sp. ANG-M1]